jgi:hypothetical protein
MRNKMDLYATVLQWLVAVVFIVSCIVLIKAGFRAFINYYKDFAVNIGVATLTIHLFVAERRLKKLQHTALAYKSRIEQAEKVASKGIGLDILTKKQQQANSAAKDLRMAEGEKGTVTWFLAVFTVLAATLSIIGYFIDLFTGTHP